MILVRFAKYLAAKVWAFCVEQQDPIIMVVTVIAAILLVGNFGLFGMVLCMAGVLFFALARLLYMSWQDFRAYEKEQLDKVTNRVAK